MMVLLLSGGLEQRRSWARDFKRIHPRRALSDKTQSAHLLDTIDEVQNRVVELGD
jgi:hypothetical protein